MRKMTKAVTFCAAAALLTRGASLTSYAAWQQEGGEWIYTDNSGSMVRDSWRQSGNYWFYLGYDGYMVRDQWIDDTYYVNEDGARLTNQWVYVDEGTYDAPNPDAAGSIWKETARRPQTAGEPSTVRGTTLILTEPWITAG